MTEPSSYTPEPTLPESAPSASPPVPEAAAADDASTVASAPGPERVGRGLLFSLAIVPAGVIVWTIIWQLGYMSAIVAFVVAVGAAWLYRRGSGGRIGGAGIASIIVVTLVTMVLAFLAGIAADVAAFLGMDLPAALGSAEFWDTFVLNLTDNPELWGDMTGDILLGLLFAALGAGSVLWNLAKEAKAAKAADAARSSEAS